MKPMACWAVVLWLGIALENSRSDLFPSCSLVLPFTVGCLYWLQNSYSVLLAGVAMMTRWLLQPIGAPIEIFAVLLLSTWSISENALSASRSDSRRSVTWFFPVCITLFATVLHAATLTSLDPGIVLQVFCAKALIAVPTIGGVLLAGRVADELGFRRHAV